MLKTSFCIVLILLFFSFLAHSAPPNPKLFFRQTEDGKLTPRMSIAEMNEMQMLDPDVVRTNYMQQSDGIEYILAIRIDFPDQPGKKRASAFDNAIFGKEGTSMYLYFDEVSYGEMQIQPGYLEGVIPSGDRWYRAKNRMSYYGAGNIMTDRYRELVEEACVSANADIDFAKYDRDNDGFIDHLMIIHSGNDEASTGISSDIWSAAVQGITGTYDGKMVASAIIVAEDPSEEYLNIGIFCHEFFHEFGAPDLYSWDYPVGYWCLMGMFGPYLDNGQHPSHICSYLKWDFDADRSNGIRGWLKPTMLDDEGTFTVECLELPGDSQSYKIDIPGTDGMEYFIIENRNNDVGAIYDTYLPESGIIISHIDENQPSSFSSPHRLWVEDPNDPDREFTIKATSGAAFSADDEQTSFTPATYPNSNSNEDSFSGIIITNIGAEGKSMSFDLFFGDSYEPNNNIAEAFGPISFDKQYISFLKDQTDIDYYAIKSETDSLVTVSLVGIPQGYSYNIKVYDSSGEIISASEDVSQTAISISFRTDKSTDFYISISSYTPNKQNQPYDLTVNSLSVNLASSMINITKVYPNPGPDSNGKITFDYRLLAPIDKFAINLYAINGELVYSHDIDVIIPNDEISLNIRDIGLASGIYIYVIKTELADKVEVKTGKIAILR